MMNDIRLESDRLIAAEYGKDDAPLLYQVLSDKEVMKYAWIDEVKSMDEMIPIFNDILKQKELGEDRRHFYFALYEKDTGEYVGFADIELASKNGDGGCGEIGYFLLKQYRGKGYATEVGRLLRDVCFEKLDLHKVFARCDYRNSDSRHVMDKMGMRQEGLMRQVRYKKGFWADEYMSGILKDEWKIMKERELER